jgi:heme exporter protein A
MSKPSVSINQTSMELQGLTCVRGGKTLFTDLSLALRPGQLLRITGSNGAGKSSLLRILCGLLLPSSGRVLWDSYPINHDRDTLHTQLIYLGHTPALKGDLSAKENIIAAASLSGDVITDQMAHNALIAAGLGHLANKLARTFSQGQKQRVALARLQLAEHKPLWLLDEPFNALDQNANEALQALIQEHLLRGGMVVLSSHQIVALDQIDRVVRVNL